MPTSRRSNKDSSPASSLSTTPAQFAAIQKIIPVHGPDAEAVAACFGKKSIKRTRQVAEILETLQGLGRL